MGSSYISFKGKGEWYYDFSICNAGVFLVKAAEEPGMISQAWQVVFIDYIREYSMLGYSGCIYFPFDSYLINCNRIKWFNRLVIRAIEIVKLYGVSIPAADYNALWVYPKGGYRIIDDIPIRLIVVMLYRLRALVNGEIGRTVENMLSMPTLYYGCPYDDPFDLTERGYLNPF